MKLSDINSVCDLLQANNKIPAINEFRRITGWRLLEAKNMVVGHDGKRTPDEFRLAAMREFISSPAELLAEFKAHVHKLERIIAQFAELCDGFQAETPPPTPKLELKLGSKVQVIQCEDGNVIGKVGYIYEVDPGDIQGLCWHFREISGDEYPYTDWFTAEELEVIA